MDESFADFAKKLLTPEQKAEYQKIGEYMYNKCNYNISNVNSKVPTYQELATYALESIKSGLHPRELSIQEIEAVCKVYGKKWYKKFDYKKSDVPQFPEV